MHDYDQIAAIVGEDKINALREAGVNIADKPSKPTTGLLGRWAKTPDGKDVLIISESVKDNGRVWVAFHTDDEEDGAATIDYCLSSLTFPEETTRPEDVPVGEAWLVNTCDGVYVKKNTVAFKHDERLWGTGSAPDGSAETRWDDYEVELIAPLIPARPMDSDRERKYWEQQAQIDYYELERTPETVTTAEEYAALPDGSIVAEQHGVPYYRGMDAWFWADMPFSHRAMAGTTRTVLRKGWGE